jgi:hypothetical protein
VGVAGVVTVSMASLPIGSERALAEPIEMVPLTAEQDIAKLL